MSMSAYEYFLLYFENPNGFIDVLSEYKEESLEAAIQLIKSGRLSSARDKQEVYDIAWNCIRDNETPNGKAVFKALLTEERFIVVKLWITVSLQQSDPDTLQSALRVIAIVITTDFFSQPQNEDFFEDVALQLCFIMYRESDLFSSIITVINEICHRKDRICMSVLEYIRPKSFERSLDPLAQKIICCFFGKICEKNLDVADHELLRLFFDSSDPLARKRAIFLIRTLIEYSKFSKEDEDSFKIFADLTESLTEPHHIILPHLQKLEKLNFSRKYSDFAFILNRFIVTHDSSIVKTRGLNFVLASTTNFDDSAVIVILNALNSSCQFDGDQNCVDLNFLNDFIVQNFDMVIRNLIAINWMSVPCYKVLQIVAKIITSSDNADHHLLTHLLKQTELIPKRVKNLVIRMGVQAQFAAIVTKLSQHIHIEKLVPILINIFNIGKAYRSLRECLAAIKPEEFEAIFNESLPKDFVSFAMIAYCPNKDLNQLKEATRALEHSDQLILNALLHAEAIDESNRNQMIETLANEIREKIFRNIENHEISSLDTNIKNFEEAMKFLMPKEEHHRKSIMKLLVILKRQAEGNSDFKFALSIAMKIALEHREIFDKSVSCTAGPDDGSITAVQCRYLILNKQLTAGVGLAHSELLEFLESFSRFVDDKTYDKITFELLNNICGSEKWSSIWRNNQESLKIVINATRSLWIRFTTEGEHQQFFNFVKIILQNLFIKNTQHQLQAEWFEYIEDCLNFGFKKLVQSDHSKLLHVIVDAVQSMQLQPSSIREYFNKLLVNKVVEMDILTKDQLTDQSVGWQIEAEFADIFDCNHLKINDRKRLRLVAAKVLATQYENELPSIVEQMMANFKIESDRKPRYFPNSFVHRMKLHSLQALVFCSHLSEKVVEILIHEILFVNNQLNVTYLIEILLARHRPNILDLLDDTSLAAKLKAPALKSIIAIAVMQIRLPDAFTVTDDLPISLIADSKLQTFHDTVMPFTMGQNFGVRSYAQAGILIVQKHVKASFPAIDSKAMSCTMSSCAIINEAIKFKNAAHYIENLLMDFRFTQSFGLLLCEETFYGRIVKKTKMSFDGIIVYPDDCEAIYFELADMQIDAKAIVLIDEIEVPLITHSQSQEGSQRTSHRGSFSSSLGSQGGSLTNLQQKGASSLNLQQKYMPFRYQVPSERVLSEFPSVFTHAGSQQLTLNPKSRLVVVASLITKAPNLGGLARTCEIFGVENFVIESLVLTENAQFKALSKTAESWLKFSEIKPYQLLDYLLGMKQQGYTIVGAEQSGNSVPLQDAIIPVKSVLVLGNERTGIPCDLLSVLDLTIEIPQCGVVRSLNVHVTGSLLIWEYSKQRLFR